MWNHLPISSPAGLTRRSLDRRIKSGDGDDGSRMGQPNRNPLWRPRAADGAGGLLHFLSTTQRSQWIECQKVSLASRCSKRRAGRPGVGQNPIAHLYFVILGGLALLKTMKPLEEDFP